MKAGRKREPRLVGDGDVIFLVVVVLLIVSAGFGVLAQSSWSALWPY